MNKKQLKKIIAREGLILLGVVAWIIISDPLSNMLYLRGDIFDKVTLGLQIRKVTYLLYVLYWAIRFIFWAIRTLRKK